MTPREQADALVSSMRFLMLNGDPMARLEAADRLRPVLARVWAQGRDAGAAEDGLTHAPNPFSPEASD